LQVGCLALLKLIEIQNWLTPFSFRSIILNGRRMIQYLRIEIRLGNILLLEFSAKRVERIVRADGRNMELVCLNAATARASSSCACTTSGLFFSAASNASASRRKVYSCASDKVDEHSEIINRTDNTLFIIFFMQSYRSRYRCTVTWVTFRFLYKIFRIGSLKSDLPEGEDIKK
jgi:hypothetical protein